MECRFTLIIISLFLFIVSPTIEVPKNDADDDDQEKEFKPTKDWQTIKEGQAIPKGLHVRINFLTGEKEAKLIDDERGTAENEEDSENTGVIHVKQHEDIDVKKPVTFGTVKTRDTIRDSLLKIDDDLPTDESNTQDAERIQKFRSYKEMKETLKGFKVNVKTEMEVVRGLSNLFQLKKDSKRIDVDEEESSALLNDLEYLVHQYDNAQEFVRSGGLTDVVFPAMNASSSKLRSQAAHILGSAAQSNPKVQIIVIEAGGLPVLLRLLALDPDPVVRTRAFFALSCLIRNFPHAQAKLIKGGGLTVLAGVFDKKGQEDLKLQVKIVTLLADLMQEREDVNLRAVNGSLEDKERSRQYATTELETVLVNQGWCERFIKLLELSSHSGSRHGSQPDDLVAIPVNVEIASVQHDVLEKVLSSILSVSKICHSEFQSDPTLTATLMSLKNWYRELAMEEQLAHSSDQFHYYSSVEHLVASVIQTLNLKRPKDEL